MSNNLLAATDRETTTTVVTARPLSGLERHVEAMREVAAQFYRRGWSLGTSSNFSVVIDRDPLELLITASGKDKGRLGRGDFVRTGADGRPTVPGQPKASAETLLHVAVAAEAGAGAVLHTHSVWATVLSDLFADGGGFEINGYEMLKGLAGVRTHAHAARVEIFENSQDIPRLADRVRDRLADPDNPLKHGFLIGRHGLYTWGRDLVEAQRHVEIFEFLFECVARRLPLTGGPPATAGPATTGIDRSS